jgi:hypothetical protein
MKMSNHRFALFIIFIWGVGSLYFYLILPDKPFVDSISELVKNNETKPKVFSIGEPQFNQGKLSIQLDLANSNLETVFAWLTKNGRVVVKKNNTDLYYGVNINKKFYPAPVLNTEYFIADANDLVDKIIGLKEVNSMMFWWPEKLRHKLNHITLSLHGDTAKFNVLTNNGLVSFELAELFYKGQELSFSPQTVSVK